MSFQPTAKRIASIFRTATKGLPGVEGSILVYIVMVMLIFGVLGVTMVTLFSTSITATAEPSESRRALYLYESGVRYGMSELRNIGFTDATINTLNQTTYNMPPSGQFEVNVFSPWFESASNQSVDPSGSVQLNIAHGKVPDGLLGTIPTSSPLLRVVNNDYINISGSGPQETAKAAVSGRSLVDADTVQLDLLDDFVVGRGENVCLSVHPFTGGQIIVPIGSLNLSPAARNIFPKRDGAIRVRNCEYFYREARDMGDHIRLLYLTPNQIICSAMMSIAADEEIILSPRNYNLTAKGRSGDVTYGGDMEHSIGITDHGSLKPGNRRPDIAFNDEDSLTGVMSKVPSTGVVNIYDDPGNKYLSLSTSGGSFGASWFKDTRSIGGVGSFCQSGGCLFNTGFRAFFIFNFTGTTGDGFTFSVLNGSNNDNSSVGGDIELSELLAYAGDSRKVSSPTSAADFLDGKSGQGLLAPKFAVEFDGLKNNQFASICQDATHVNVGTRNDPEFSGNNRDTVQYVFWGKDSLIYAPCRINTFVSPNTNKTYDDNRHDAVTAIWIRDTGAKSLSSLAIDAALGNVYAGLSSENTQLDGGSLINLRTSDGFINWQKNPDATIGNDDDINSSPTIDGTGHIYIGSDGFLIAKYNSGGSNLWITDLANNIEGKPAVSDLKNRVYVVTDAARLWSLNKTDGTSQWPLPFDIGFAGGNYTSWPVIRYDAGLNKNIIYVGSTDGRLYAVRDDGAAGAILNSNFPYPTGGAIRGTPAINPVSGNVYFGSDDGTLYALSSLGADLWSFTPVPIAAIVSSPAVTIDGGTVYVGSTNGHLYALNAINGSPLWKYPDPGRTPGDPIRIGDVRGAPVIMGDGAICFGSDDGHLYALNPNGTLRWYFPATGSPVGAVRSKPVVDPSGVVYFGAEDGKIYAIDPSVNDPPNIPNLHLTAAELGATVSDVNNWFTEGPWAVRVEVQRSIIPNGSGKFEYTLKTWMRKCVNGVNCTNVLGQFFENTRYEYDWTAAGITPMTQTIELSNTPDSFHDRFDRFLFGFTSASTSFQTIDIRNFQLSFIRPNDPVQSD